MIRNEHPWEKILGKDAFDRTRNLGLENAEYRETVHLPPINEAVQKKHNVYIHQIGADVLQTKMDEKAEAELARLALKNKLTKVGKILRKKIKVTDIQDGGVSIAIDQEWDTSTWTDELIEAGCEALILIFYESDGTTTMERKERAVQMLQKLLARHSVAENYVRKNIEMMIGKATSKLIKGGKCGGLLDLLYILNSCKETFTSEMSQFNYNGRALDMLNQEAKLAAIIIQHSYRAKRYSTALKSYTLTIKGFGTEREARMSRLGVVNARSNELRAKWRSLRCFHNEKELQMCGGLRGPIHIGAKYTELTLEIILHLLSDKAHSFAQSNREDVVRSNGCILLATYLAFPTGRFAFVSAAILANIAKVSESFEPLLTSGTIYSVVKLLKYLRMIGIGTQNIKEKRGVRYSMLDTYVNCVDIVYATAVHAAGLFRAINDYGYVKDAQGEVEKVNYKMVLSRLKRRSTTLLSKDVIQYLGDFSLLKELCTMILQTNHAIVLAKLLRCLFTMLCSFSHNSVTTEITALSGVLIIRLTELLHAKDNQIGTLSLCIFMQLCVTSPSRKSLMIVQLPKYLVPLNAITTDYSKRYHQRSIMAAIVLCRQSEWRYYDPQVLPAQLLNGDDVVRQSIFLEILRTMKAPSVEIADALQIADLVILPTHERRVLKMSKSMCNVGPRFIAEFVCHPEDNNYYESLPLEESSAVCAILEGIVAHPDTARQVFSVGVVRFVSRYSYLCKYLFLGKPMADAQIMVLLNGVLSASTVMSKLCGVCEARHDSLGDGKEMERANVLIVNIRACELISSVLFFLNTLSVLHPKLEETTHELQKKVGISCLSFFNNYAKLLISLEGHSKVSSLEDLYVPGTTVINLIKLLRSVHGKSASIVTMFDHMCELLCKITIFPAAAFIAVQEWGVVSALRIYLPPPLSGVLDEAEMAALTAFDNDDDERDYYNSHNHTSNNSVCSTVSASSSILARRQRRQEIKAYRMGLDQLPASFFELCANLCQTADGIAYSLTDGFLRRSLDKLVMLHAKVQRVGTTNSVLKHLPNWNSMSAEFVGCLRLVKKCANFHRAQMGSSNDVILHPFYPIVSICKDVITRKELPRTDEIILISYEVLAALARDTYRVSLLLEQQDIFSVIQHELFVNIEQFPIRGAVAAMEVLHYSCFGLTSDYIVRMIPLLREPLSKVARVYPSISTNVREANWTLTKSAMIYRNTVTSSGLHDEQAMLSGAMEDFIRTGETPLMQPLQSRHKSFAMRSLSQTTTNLESMLASAETSIATVSDAYSNHYTGCRDPTHNHNAEDAGTFLYCGVSSCGSLRLALDNVNTNGLMEDSRSSLVKRSLSTIHVGDSGGGTIGVCAVSQLSARDPGLRDRLEERKGIYGFAEKKKLDVYRMSATSSPAKLQNQLSNSPSKKNVTTSRQVSSPIKMQTITLQELPELILTRPPGKPLK